MKGYVKSYSDFSGYGFITGEDGNEYFAHASKIVGDNIKSMDSGDQVTFSAQQNYKGKYASEICIIQRKNKIEENQFFTLKRNPFTPQEPITDANKFAGRKDAIRTSIDNLYNEKNILISGPRGIGKSSLAYQLLYTTSGELDLLKKINIMDEDIFNNSTCDHRCMRGNTLSDIASGLLVTLCKSMSVELTEKSTSQLGLDFKWFSYTHTETLANMTPSDVVSAFTTQVEKIFDQQKHGKVGVTFLVDEIDVLDPEIDIASFFKAVIEKFRLDNYKSFFFIVSGVSGTIIDLISQHSSAGRLFEAVELEKMSHEDLTDIIRFHLDETGVTIGCDEINKMVMSADYFPQPIHLIGYHAFRIDSDNNIDLEDINKAILYIVQKLKNQEYKIKFDNVKAARSTAVLRCIAQSKDPSISLQYLFQHIEGTESEIAGAIGELIQNEVLEKYSKTQYRIREPLFLVYLKIIFGIS